MSGTSNKRHFD